MRASPINERERGRERERMREKGEYLSESVCAKTSFVLIGKSKSKLTTWIKKTLSSQPSLAAAT